MRFARRQAAPHPTGKSGGLVSLAARFSQTLVEIGETAAVCEAETGA